MQPVTHPRASRRSASSRTARRFRLLAALGLLSLVCSQFLAPATPAFAVPMSQVTIERTSPSPQASGETFVYELQYQCSDIDGMGCEDNIITIPLGSAAGFDIDVSAGSPVASWAVVGTDLVITLEPEVDAGASSTIQLQMTPPNHTTPDGTTWSLLPVVTGSNTDPSAAPAAADGTATAELIPTIAKSAASAFAQPGQSATWNIEVGCQQQEAGSVGAQSMIVTDQLPEGFDFGSASGGGAYDPVNHTVTWTYPDLASVPTSCSEAGSNGTITQTITGEVSASQAPNTALLNTAEVSAVPLGRGDPVTREHDASISIWNDANPPSPGPFTLAKSGVGQLAGPNQANNTTGSETWATTYPGNWMGVPETAHLGNGGAPNFPSNYRNQNWSGYYSGINLGVGGDGFQSEFRDKMPCLDNYAAPVYSQSASNCQNPAFHATMITVYQQRTVANSGTWAQSLVPYAILTDGSTANLVRQSGVAANAMQVNYAIPESALGQVAEIVVPKHPGAIGMIQRFYIGGYVDSSITNGSILENYSNIELFWQTATTPSAERTSNRGRIFVIDAPQIGAGKTLGAVGAAAGGSTAMTLTGQLATLGVPSEDLVIADLMPVGMRLASASSTVDVDYRVTTGDDDGQSAATGSITLPLEVIDNYQGSGRQLMRFTVDQQWLEQNASPLAGESGTKYLLTANSLVVATPTAPGVYLNSVSAFYDRDDLDSKCMSFIAQTASDPGDLSGNGDTSDRHCESRDAITITSSVPGPGFTLEKTVQGSSDAFPRRWPSVARVDALGGTVKFGVTFTNSATDPLNGVVLYDVFPSIGDLGVSASLGNQPRNSDFTPILSSVGALPAGVSIAYSTEINPCRDEVYPDAQNTTCVNDWSTTAPADLTTVTALRLTSSDTYTSGQGFTVNFNMTTPSITEGEIAWNSVAGIANSALTSQPLLASEPPKVGMTAVSGDLPPEIQKTVDQTTAVPGDTLTYTMQIANLDLVTLTGLAPVDTLPAGVTFVSASDGGVYNPGTHSVSWSGLSLDSGVYKDLTVEVTVDAGTSGELINRFTLDGALVNFQCADDATASCATTEVAAETLVIRKVVTGAASSYAAGPYTVVVDCRAGGASTTGFPQSVVLPAAGDSNPISVPIGATCTATETVTGGATGVTITPVGGQTITQGGTDPFLITVTNEFRAGSLVISKSLTGVGAEEFGSEKFTFGVTCSFNGVAGVFTTSVQLQRIGTESVLTSAPITGLPIGAECVVTETANGGADTTPPPVTVTITENAQANTVIAAFINRFSASTLNLSKVLAGAGANSPHATASVYTVLVTCEIDLGGTPPTVGTLFSGSVDIRGGESTELKDAGGNTVLLPVGARCWGVETQLGGADGVSINFDSATNAAIVTGGTPSRLQQIELIATNTFNTAQLVVSKQVVGSGAAGPYTFALECTLDGAPYVLSPEDAQFTLSHGESRSITVGDGANCSARELRVPGDATVTIRDTDVTTAGGAGDGVLTNIQGEARIAFTNTFPAATGLSLTGAMVGAPLVTIGVLLLGGTVLLLVARRKREEKHEQS